jgi:hypothetical protein
VSAACPANGRPRDKRVTRGSANGQKVAPDCPMCHQTVRYATRPVASESHLEGMDRRKLKFTNLKHNYKPGLALEIKPSPKERVKNKSRQIKWMTR